MAFYRNTVFTMFVTYLVILYLSDIGADVLDLSGSTLELGDKLKLEPVGTTLLYTNMY